MIEVDRIGIDWDRTQKNEKEIKRKKIDSDRLAIDQDEEKGFLKYLQ